MVVIQASKLNLTNLSLSSPHVLSLIVDPSSLSLALIHSDSSISLYPNLSHLSPSFSSSPSLPPPQTIIPSPSSSCCFLKILNPNPNPNLDSRVVFLVSSPIDGGRSVLLQFWILGKIKQVFSRVGVICNQSGIHSHEKLGVVVSLNHGISVKLCGSVNVFAMQCVSARQIWIFAVKLVGDDDDGAVKLMKCAVIDCCLPIFTMSVSFGFLILGESDGVRVFPLRPLVKGRAKKQQGLVPKVNHGLNKHKVSLPNGEIPKKGAINGLYGSVMTLAKYENGGIAEGTSEIISDERLDAKIDKNCSTVKFKPVKLRQDSSKESARFVAFRKKGADHPNSKTTALVSAKAIAVQALSHKKFLVLDSAGDLHLLCLATPVIGSEITCNMRQFTDTMKVQKLAIFADISIKTQTFWISDGSYTVQKMAMSDADTSDDESDRNGSKEKTVQLSVLQAIFTSEKIQDIVPLAANALLILGQALHMPSIEMVFVFQQHLDDLCLVKEDRGSMSCLRAVGSIFQYVIEVKSCSCLVNPVEHIITRTLSSKSLLFKLIRMQFLALQNIKALQLETTL
ncbi:hypothetical protein RJ641_023078, partial [Dillenia turbinata]